MTAVPIDGLQVARLIDVLPAAEIVAGVAGQQRVVASVVVLSGRSARQVQAGAVALVAWRRSRGSGELVPLRPLIERLAAVEAAALVIARLDGPASVPPDARAAADDLGLPVISVASAADPAELRRLIDDALMAATTARELRAADLHTMLIGALRGGVTPPELVDALASGFGAPVAVTDRLGRVVASAPAGAPAVLLTMGITDANGWLRDAEEVPGAQSVAVLHAGQRIGTLLLASTEQLPDAHQAVLDAAASVLALSMHTSEIEGADKHLEREVLTEILGENLQVRERAIRRAGRAGVFPTRAHRVLAVQPVGTTVGQVGMRRLAARLEGEVTARDARSVVIAHEGHIVVLLAAAVDAEALTRALRRRTPVPLAFGTGPPITELRRLATAHRQAQRAMLIGQRVRRAGHLARYEELGAFRLLYLLPEHERQQFVREVLGTLADSTPEAGEWRRTLRVLIECGGNVAEAARRLFLHYNTLRYRIERLEQLVGPVFSDADQRLAVHVALALHRLDPSD